MDLTHSTRTMRTREAIERTAVVVVGTLVEPGTVSPGPPGAHDIDNAGFRIVRTLTPGAPAGAVAPTVRVSYTRQVLPEGEADPPLERGQPYILFANIRSPQKLLALKVIPHSDENARIVASAFDAGARHPQAAPGPRVA